MHLNGSNVSEGVKCPSVGKRRYTRLLNPQGDGPTYRNLSYDVAIRIQYNVVNRN